MKLSDYPKDWPRISLEVRGRSLGRCECEGECGRDHGGRCPRHNGDVLSVTVRWVGRVACVESWPVVLTVAHLWRGPCAEHDAAGVKCGEPDHLKAMCQPCHLRYDRVHHIARRKRNRFNARAAGDLFE